MDKITDNCKMDKIMDNSKMDRIPSKIKWKIHS